MRMKKGNNIERKKEVNGREKGKEKEKKKERKETGKRKKEKKKVISRPELVGLMLS